jgi:hypothetical protein
VLEKRLVLGSILATSLAAGPATAVADGLDDWRFETELGYARAGGALAPAFGGGVSVGWTIGRRLGPPVVEAGVHLAWADYSDAETLTTRVCSPIGPQSLACADRPRQQQGRRSAAMLGLSLPLALGSSRTLQVGAGAFLGGLSVEPAGDAAGSRDGSGLYLKLAADVVTIGPAGVGLLIRAARGTSHGEAFGTTGWTDDWIEANVLLRIGAGARRGPGAARP